MPNHRIQGHRLPVVLKRGLAAIAGWGLSLGCLFSHAAEQVADQAAVQINAPLVDYDTTQLAQLESLDDLVPDNLFTIEVIFFKRLDTSSALLAQAENSGSSAETLDSREPLLIVEPRSLPANLFDLSPAARIDDLDLPLAPATPRFCFGPDSVEPLEPAEPAPLQDLMDPADQGVNPTGQPASELSTTESAPTTLFGGENGTFSAEFSADLSGGTLARDSFASDTLAPLPEPQFLAVPRNHTEITPTPYLALIQGVTVFLQGMAHNAYRQMPDEQRALHDLVRRLENSGEFEVLQQLAWQQPVPERGNPQPIYVNLSNGELQGHMAVTLGRFLHTQATLWLRPTPAEPTSDFAGYARLDQSQRMRSGELHYFDHPLFGLLVRIDKLSPPAELQAQFETFQLGLENPAP